MGRCRCRDIQLFGILLNWQADRTKTGALYDVGARKHYGYRAIAGTVVFAIFGFVLAFLLSSITDFSFGSVIYGGILGASVALIYGLIAGPSNLNGNVSE